MTDFRALCAELRDELEQYLDGYLEADAPDENTAETEQLLNRARAALAQPEPQGLTDEKWFADFAAWLAREMPAGTVIANPLWWAPRIARAVLARWGCQ